MSKYIDSEKLIAEIDNRLHCNGAFDEVGDYAWHYDQGMVDAYKYIRKFITSLQQEQPIEGKQVVIITEADGDANIHWDCRSLDDVEALLKSAESFITEKQIEKMAGPGSGPDYATEEGRYSYLFKHRQERPEVDLEKELEMWRHDHFKGVRDGDYYGEYLERESQLDIARHFFELGLNARKEENK